MADVAVVGAGLGGLATAARLAKLGHRVTVFEATEAPGGLLRRRTAVDPRTGRLLGWDARAFQTTLPAVLRDLFRKSGRPLERYTELELSTPARRHVFEDGATLDLTTGSRGAQLDALAAALGPKLAESWTLFVDGQADTWDLVRREVLDLDAGSARLTDRRLARASGAHQTLDRRLRRLLKDDRLRALASYPLLRAGASPGDAPGHATVLPYLERTVGVWRTPRGSADLTSALVERLSERSVELRYGSTVRRLRAVAGGRWAVEIADDSRVEVDLVVTAIRPGIVFGALLDHPRAGTWARSIGPIPADVPAGTATRDQRWRSLDLAVAGALTELPDEVVLHGAPNVVLDVGERHPDVTACTVTVLGPRLDPDPGQTLELLASRGLDLRDRATTIAARISVAPALPWVGTRQAAARAALANPLPGLHCLGLDLPLGRSVPWVGWQAANVATRIGAAPRR